MLWRSLLPHIALVAVCYTLPAADSPLNNKLPSDEDVKKHWLGEKQMRADDNTNSQVDAFNIVLDTDVRIRHCPLNSTVQRETQHNELDHAYINYVLKTCIYSLIIALGLLCNFFNLAVLQYLQVSPMRVVMRAEAAVISAYLIILIPLYPVANLYPYTGQFKLYEVAKPYVTTFFQSCLDIAEFLMIWTFVWLSKLRHTFVVLQGTTRVERCTTKSVRDEVRVMLCIAIVMNLPKFFESDIKLDSDPCNPGTTIVVREPNALGGSVYFILLYRVICISLIFHLMPLVWLANLTYTTHRAVRKSERPAGDTKQTIMRDRARTTDSLTTELDVRILLFYVLVMPGAFYDLIQHLEFFFPVNNQGYEKVVEVSEQVTMFLSTIHAAFAPFATYMIWYTPYREMAKEKYWDHFKNVYNKYQRRRQLELDFQQLERRLKREETEGEVRVELSTSI